MLCSSTLWQCLQFKLCIAYFYAHDYYFFHQKSTVKTILLKFYAQQGFLKDAYVPIINQYVSAINITFFHAAST